MAKSNRRLKLSVNMKPYIGRVSRDGVIQNAFGEQIGKPAGACVSSRTKGKVGELSGAQIHAIAKGCTSQYKGTQLTGPFVHGKGLSAKIERARRRAGQRVA